MANLSLPHSIIPRAPSKPKFKQQRQHVDAKLNSRGQDQGDSYGLLSASKTPKRSTAAPNKTNTDQKRVDDNLSCKLKGVGEGVLFALGGTMGEAYGGVSLLSAGYVGPGLASCARAAALVALFPVTLTAGGVYGYLKR